MNFAIAVTSALQRGVKPLFASNSGLLAQQTRNTFILKRKYPPRLHKKNSKPHKLGPRNFIYQLVTDTDVQKQKQIDIILTSFVTGVGNVGETVSVPSNQAYNKFLLPGLAVYANPDNVEKYKDIIEKAKSELPIFSSPWVSRTINMLSTHLLTVIVSMHHPWTVEKYHIRVAFRKVNYHVPDDAITMPERPITGPNLDKENKEFYVTVTINNREQVKVRCRLHHYSNKESEKILCNDFWKKAVPAIYPEDQPILDSMPRHREFKDTTSI